jgi:hypothetical protein
MAHDAHDRLHAWQYLAALALQNVIEALKPLGVDLLHSSTLPCEQRVFSAGGVCLVCVCSQEAVL